MSNETIYKIKQPLANFLLRQRVHNPDFTLVSVNCWGSTIYRELKRPYNTPFVGLFIPAAGYIKLLGDLKNYLAQELSFVSVSRFDFANALRRKRNNYYPIGILGGDIEIHFLHYESESLALEKWTARRMRMNMDNLFVQFSDEYECEQSHLLEFDRLDFPRKVAFTANPHPELKSAVWLSEYAGQPQIQNPFTERYVYRRHFDVADWLNGGTGAVTPAYRLLNRLLEVSIKG